MSADRTAGLLVPCTSRLQPKPSFPDKLGCRLSHVAGTLQTIAPVVLFLRFGVPQRCLTTVDGRHQGIYVDS